MAAIMLSLVYRQVRDLREIVRLLETEGRLWVEAMRVSKQALSQRMSSLPAELFIQMFAQVVERRRQQPNRAIVSQSWQQIVQQQFAAVWIADGSTLERLQRHLGQLQAQMKNLLAGKVMMVVEVLSHRPVAVWYEQDASRHETKWWQELLALLPVSGQKSDRSGLFWFSVVRCYDTSRQVLSDAPKATSPL